MVYELSVVADNEAVLENYREEILVFIAVIAAFVGHRCHRLSAGHISDVLDNLVE